MFKAMFKGFLRTRFQTLNVRPLVAKCRKDMNVSEKGSDISAVRLKKEASEANLKQFSIANWDPFLGPSSLVYRATYPDLLYMSLRTTSNPFVGNL